ncbi:glycosyltransferase [Solitalea sp. MAHUQ-68]|uniref:Glycosyltransferase n=1 Tax=Solitalea agri TaxID=2953739 RepID=A0A9X2JF82_9SPHI|nr:glycosyltransferase family 2 protein [Solitalea agri]MCO4293126.1 glycosyltransferase [Solitalea agri]
MKVSIITVVYNNKETIDDTIKSILNQSYKNIEYIIIDGNSNDGTCEIIKSYGDKITKFISEPDKGIYDAMNKGLSLAIGDVIGILNADDFYVNNNVISKIVAAFDQTHCDAVYSDLIYVDQFNISKQIRKWKTGKYKPGSFLNGWMPPHPTFFVRREVYEEHGLFNTLLRSAADYEIMLRFIHKHKIKLGYIPEVLVKMRAGGVSNVSLKNRLRANKEDRMAWQINGLKPYFFTTWLKPLRKISQFI